MNIGIVIMIFAAWAFGLMAALCLVHRSYPFEIMPFLSTIILYFFMTGFIINLTF